MAFITIWIASKIEVHPVTKNTIKLPCPFVKEKLYTFILIINIISLFKKIPLHPLEGLIWYITLKCHKQIHAMKRRVQSCNSSKRAPVGGKE